MGKSLLEPSGRDALAGEPAGEEIDALKLGPHFSHVVVPGNFRPVALQHRTTVRIDLDLPAALPASTLEPAVHPAWSREQRSEGKHSRRLLVVDAGAAFAPESYQRVRAEGRIPFSMLVPGVTAIANLLRIVNRWSLGARLLITHDVGPSISRSPGTRRDGSGTTTRCRGLGV